MLTVPYEHALLIQTIPTAYPDLLCTRVDCTECPAQTNPSNEIDYCQFVIYYKTQYTILSKSLRPAALAQYPPHLYPELYL